MLDPLHDHDAESEARACEALSGVFDVMLLLTELSGKYYYDSVACQRPRGARPNVRGRRVVPAR
jgi:hypothetical protein